jgi:hypothetical protein
MSNLLGIQIIGVLFALLMLYLTFLHLRRKEFTVKETIFWFGAWIVFLFLAIFPMGFDFIIKNWLSFERRLDFFIVIGFMFLIGMIFHMYTIMRKLQNKVEKIVSRMAMNTKK